MTQLPGILFVSPTAEPTSIQAIFSDLAAQGGWRIKALHNPSFDVLIGEIGVFQPTILHVFGAGSAVFSAPEADQRPAALTHTLTQLPELKLIFLHRSASFQQGKDLCYQGVPNVVVVNGPAVAEQFANDQVAPFYRALVAGKTVQAAFEQLSADGMVKSSQEEVDASMQLFSYGNQEGWSLPIIPATETAEPVTRGGEDFDWFDNDGGEAARGGDVFGEAPAGAAPEAFEAYPHISDPGPVAQGAKFEIAVGFREELDESLEGVQKIFIEKPKEIDFVDVLVVAVGARMDQQGMQKLFLNLNSQIRVGGTVLPQSEEVLLTVLYFYNGQPVGQGTRRLAVQGFAVADQEPGTPAEPLAVGKEMEPVDLVVTATYSAPNQLLSWRIVAGGKEVGTPTEIEFAEGRQFAGQMMSSLLAESFAGQAAWNILQGLGLRVGQLYPPAFYSALRELNDQLDRPPRVLLLTNEFYVPWELAFHADLALDAAHPPFLNLQTEIGRWLISAGITRRPVDTLPFDQFCVVAADYPFDSDQIPLEEALKEKKELIEAHHGTAIEAKKAELLGLAGQTPAVGRILHLALHGYSRPDLNEQSIALEDGSLSAEGWLPVPLNGQKPVLSFVFLNACQVGTAGSHLSQAGGFPGALFLRGLLGFIAPLWDVHDAKARAFSEGFYQQVLQGGEPVGKTILALRRRIDYHESVTEMAYVYYGHPGMRLEFATQQDA